MPKPHAQVTGRLCSPITIGRDLELATLLDAAKRQPALALVSGEAGIGKTRLIQDLLGHPDLARHQRLLGTCYDLADPLQLGPVIEALRLATPPRGLPSVCGALHGLLPELTPCLPAPLDPLHDVRAERHRLLWAVRELLASLGPTVLVLEDLHWADPATAQVLRYLLQKQPADLTLVATFRAEDLPLASPVVGLAARAPSQVAVVDVPLVPLDAEQLQTMVGAILESDRVSEPFAEYLLERTAGIPFAVEEALLLLQQRPDVAPQHDVWLDVRLDDLAVPHRLRDSIVERLERLDPGARAVVQAASVLKPTAPEQVLLHVAGLTDPEVNRALAGALRSALLLEVGRGEYAFRHTLARQAVEDTIPGRLRRLFHRRAAEALERHRPDLLAQLAHHHRHSGNTEIWIEYAEAAADRAVSLRDDASAYRLLKDALTVDELPIATRGRLAIKLAHHALECLEHDEAIALVTPLLDEDLPTCTRGQLHLALGRLRYQAGDSRGGYLEYHLAIDDLREMPELTACLMGLLARPWSAEGTMSEHLRYLDEASSIVARSADDLAKSQVAVDRAIALLTFGDPRCWTAIEEIQPAGPGVLELRLAAKAKANLSAAALKIGHFSLADEFVQEGFELAARADNARVRLVLQCNQLLLDWATGRWSDVEERAQSLVDAMPDQSRVQTDARTVLGLIRLANGNVKAARQLLELDVECAPAALPALAWAAAGTARIHLAQDNPHDALAALVPLLDVVQRKGVWTWSAGVVPLAVEAMLLTDRRPDADRLTKQLREGLIGRDAPAAFASLELCDGLLAEDDGDHRLAAERCRTAARMWAALPSPYDAAIALAHAGRCLLGHHRHDGRDLLLETAAQLRALGARWDEGRVRRILRSHGFAIPHSRGRKGYGTKLTPREAEVVDLACQGLTNREIGMALFLARKTVERHLSSAMRKLQVSSRHELRDRPPD